jgi:hypothetical protein
VILNASGPFDVVVGYEMKNDFVGSVFVLDLALSRTNIGAENFSCLYCPMINCVHSTALMDLRKKIRYYFVGEKIMCIMSAHYLSLAAEPIRHWRWMLLCSVLAH